MALKKQIIIYIFLVFVDRGFSQDTLGLAYLCLGWTSRRGIKSSEASAEVGGSTSEVSGSHGWLVVSGTLVPFS